MPSKTAQIRFDTTSPGAKRVLQVALGGLDFNDVVRSSDRVSGRITIQDGHAALGVRGVSVDYPVLANRDWTDARRQAAGRVAAHWCRAIGNIDRIDKPLMSHVIQRLKRYTEIELHCAVAAYARSKWHREKRAWMRPRRFFTENGVIAEWLGKSPEYRRLLDDVAAGRGAPSPPGVGDGIATESVSAAPTLARQGVDTRSSVAHLTDDALRAEYRKLLTDRRLAEQDHAEWSAKRDAAIAAAWDSLAPEQRKRIVADVERELSRGRTRRDGTAILDCDETRFRYRCHLAGWKLAMAGDAQQRRRFTHAAPRARRPTTRFPHDQIDSEARRRACTGYRRPEKPPGGYTAKQQKTIRAAEQQAINLWLTGDPP